jgi:hypothetical protein
MTNYSDDRDFWQDLADSLFDPSEGCFTPYYDEYEDDWIKKMELMKWTMGLILMICQVLEQGRELAGEHWWSQSQCFKDASIVLKFVESPTFLRLGGNLPGLPHFFEVVLSTS